jgi:Sulfotransferase domain
MLGSDRQKRRAILGSSAVLPRPLRVAVREHLLEGLELGRARRSPLFLVGHPKSGNTWLRTMVSRAYQARYGLPETLVLKSDELALANPQLPRFCVTNGHYSYERVVGRILDAEHPDPEFADRRLVFLARHPCDIAVSWYLQFTKRISPAKRELINANLSRPIDPERISRWDFVMNEEIGLRNVIAFLNRWERNARALRHHLIVHYEDLRTETAVTLSRILEFWQQPFTPREIEAAVSFASFDNLKQLEASGFFRHGGLALQNAGDPETFKVRRAKIHGYRDDFEPSQVAELDELVAKHLSPTLGYGRAAAAGTTGSA